MIATLRQIFLFLLLLFVGQAWCMTSSAVYDYDDSWNYSDVFEDATYYGDSYFPSSTINRFSKSFSESSQVRSFFALSGIFSITKRTAPSLEDQAKAIKHQLNNDKNSVTIQTPNQKIHFDLDGPTHKGVPTPHKQYSNPNTNPNTGQTFWNKDSKTVDPMTQQDIRIIRKYLERQNQ